MDEITKIRYEIDSEISVITSLMEQLDGAIKNLPKAIEKEVELKDGDIYKYTLHKNLKDCKTISDGVYYLLERVYGEKELWSLRNLKMRNVYWALKIPHYDMKRQLKRYFTLCPNAFIHVVPGDKE
jgi:hypothetical protein